ncbi:MAG: hypothetical protein KGZ25_11700 [Planctomycetes bacterium]|nr:hypothetical protein [Planctomycetota bacterium]
MDRTEIQIRGYVVDLPAVLGITHRCDPLLCRASGSCCRFYDAWISKAERSRILDHLEDAAQFAPRLKRNGTSADLFKELNADLFAIRKDETELCVFAFRGEKNEFLCSLHAAALRNGHEPEDYKPRDCVLWPLMLTSNDPPILSVQPEAMHFPCNSERASSGDLDAGIENIIRKVFGSESLRLLRTKIARGQ